VDPMFRDSGLYRVAGAAYGPAGRRSVLGLWLEQDEPILAREATQQAWGPGAAEVALPLIVGA
jgi:hypothetical protein